MRIAIFSDVHANLPALEAVLANIEATAVDARYALGDLVGYAPWPNEVLERLRAEGIPIVMGNYDDGTGFGRDECGCAYVKPTDKAEGDAGFAWTKAHTNDANTAWLRTLHPQIRFVADGKRYLLVHGSPRRINDTRTPQASGSSAHACALASPRSGRVIARAGIPISSSAGFAIAASMCGFKAAAMNFTTGTTTALPNCL